MAAGSISKEEFKRFASKFIHLTEKTNDLWKIKDLPVSLCSCKAPRTFVQYFQTATNNFPLTSDGQCYLYKKEVKKVTSINKEKKQQEKMNSTVEDSCEIFQSSDVYLTYEYHIVYSESYMVPVLYFNVYHQSGQLLSLDEVWSYIPASYNNRLLQDRWSFLTQQEHPIQGRPFFMLHPCHTKDLMAQVATIPDDKQSNYILSWLSAVGPVVGIHISPVCGQIEPDTG